MRMIPWRLLGAAVSTAVLLDLPFPLAGPLPHWRTAFAWFALVPLLVALLRLPLREAARSKRETLGWSFSAGWLCGAIWFGANCYWVYDTMHQYAGMSAPLSALSLVLFSLYLGIWFGLFALALSAIRLATVGGKLAWVGVAAIPFLWVGMEFGLARIPQFPWDLLGYSQVDNALLMRMVPWTGVYGVSFVLAAINGLLAGGRLFQGTRPEKWNPGAIIHPTQIGFLLSAVTAFAWGTALLPSTKTSPTEATAMLIQPNLDVATDDVWSPQEWDQRVAQDTQFGGEPCRAYLVGIPERNQATSEKPGCDNKSRVSLVVLPESPAPFRDRDGRFQSAMASIAAADKAPLIVGAIGIDFESGAGSSLQQYRIYNSAVVIGRDGQRIGRYDKIHLVPFGEYVPLRKLLFFVRQVTQTLTDMSTGTERKVFTLGGHGYGVFICYESVFGDEVRHFALNGAQVFVNISDDGWYGDTSAPWQHLNMARMRAIENRRWILRDTNTGATVAIDPYGVVRQSIPRHEVGALAAQYGYETEVTFYTEHGDWVAWICAACALVITVWAVRVLLLGKIAKMG